MRRRSGSENGVRKIVFYRILTKLSLLFMDPGHGYKISRISVPFRKRTNTGVACVAGVEGLGGTEKGRGFETGGKGRLL